MREITGNIWDYRGSAVLAITTNGAVAGNGKAVIGRGCAKQALEHYPDLAERLGLLIREKGNHVHFISEGLVSFPVEESPWEHPDLRLIAQSARELRELADRHGWPCIVVPRPGCGGGGLEWEDVRPLLKDSFDSRFIIITKA